jgi:hypothetical protein
MKKSQLKQILKEEILKEMKINRPGSILNNDFVKRSDMESAFKNKGVKIDVHDFTKDSGFFTTYDNISKEELQKIADELNSSYNFKVSNPTKAQEFGYYLLVSWNKNI